MTIGKKLMLSVGAMLLTLLVMAKLDLRQLDLARAKSAHNEFPMDDNFGEM